MARPIKHGLDYWPVDTGFMKDIKVRKIKMACGPVSLAILFSLLSNIYGDSGYFVAWDEDMPFLIADEVGVSEIEVNDVVAKAIQVGFFSQKIFDEYRVLTSAGIQKRYLKAIERRKQIEIVSQYCLVKEPESIYANIVYTNVDINPINDEPVCGAEPINDEPVCGAEPINVDINSINERNSTQSKVKERKGEERIREENEDGDGDGDGGCGGRFDVDGVVTSEKRVKPIRQKQGEYG